ncbi:lens fiber membrane intrinsic protein-like isoform X1 [Hydra vulgaris]|uniref:lens fiber membrane intrinsic protein-like isoform X1 n=1 Tax=Hydra vulgaris TaxID=6087 RepID=UPI000640DE9E
MVFLNIIYCVLTCAGMGLAILSTVGNYWVGLASVDLQYFHSGLWIACAFNTCLEIKEELDYLYVTRAFMIIGCMSYFVTFVLSLLSYSKKIKNHKISGAFLCATGIFLAIGLSVFTNEGNKNSLIKYSWSYIIGWCSFAISIISACICFAIKVETEST